MFIVMHCGGLPFNGDTIKKSSLGGSETAAYYVAKELAELGHRVTIFTNSKESGVFDGVKYEWAGELTNDAPLGTRFTFYAENTPHDVCIIQRHPQAFARKYASKINLWWLHDLALVRNRDVNTQHMWNIDRVLCVSEFHKKQVCDIWGLDKDVVAVVNNGVDLTLFENVADMANITSPRGKRLIYSSRPERGLINLVGPDGIMERLLKADPDYHLYVCGYSNTTPDMEAFYTYLWDRCDELPNVTNLGALTKQELAAAMSACDALVYPTTFEEVSCITVMEAMAAGLQIISSEWAALPETCADSTAILVKPLDDGRVDIPLFVELIQEFASRDKILSEDTQKVASKYTWKRCAETMLKESTKIFQASDSVPALAFHFMRHSDIPAFEMVTAAKFPRSPLMDVLSEEYSIGYKFYREDTYAEHYAAYYAYEKNRGVDYGPEDVSNTARYQHIANLISALPAGGRVLDYGCAHGHYTINLAKRFPHLSFVGVDLAQSNLDTAQKWANDEGLTNVQFIKVAAVDSVHRIADMAGEALPANFDRIIAAEVVEHVGNPQLLVDSLAGQLADGGQLIITTPYGPWEAQGYREHTYWRAHLHHFERADLHDMFSHHPGFNIVAAPSGQSQFASALGSYIVTFNKPTQASRQIDYGRKITETAPDQTLSVCMIVKDAEADIKRCLDSVLPYAQEVVIGIDSATTDNTRAVVESISRANPLVAFCIFRLPVVTEIGFAAARNETVKRVSCDWVMWIDSDEVLINGSRLPRILRNNQYNGYAVKQHHMSCDPVGVIKVDLPCRIFRNHKGIQFFGHVHEHPERALNEGLGPVMLAPGIEIMHHGYTTETVRRGRFARNINLLKRDRRELPERLLGKFLWLRDLAQMCEYDAENYRRTGQTPNSDELEYRIKEGLRIWDELMASKNVRLIQDALPYYSRLVEIKGGGFDFGFTIGASKMNGGVHLEREPTIQGHFLNKAHAFALMELVSNERTADYESRYF